MGSEDFYPEERPLREVSVDGFWMDEHPVTAAEFRRFVRETGYVTLAERPLDAADYPDADPELLVPGSLVFVGAAGPVPLDDVANWWEYRPGAFWKRPGGKGTTINGRDNHPVDARRVGGRRSLCGLGGQGDPDRGRVGAGSPRRPRGRRLRVGRRALPRGNMHGEHLAGGVPVAEPEARRVRAHLAREEASLRTDSGSTTSRETCGSGRATGTRRTLPSRRPLPAARPAPRSQTRRRATRWTLQASSSRAR